MSGFRDKGAREIPTAGTDQPHFHGHRERLKAQIETGDLRARIDRIITAPERGVEPDCG